MKRVVPVLAAAALVAPAAPARAHPAGVCALADARMTLSRPVFPPTEFLYQGVEFWMVGGGCEFHGVFAVASCDNFVGSGVVFDGVGDHDFEIVAAEGAYVTGEAVGVLTVVPDVRGGQTCLTPTGADTFAVNGTVVTR